MPATPSLDCTCAFNWSASARRVGELDKACATRAGDDWLVGDAMTHADIAVACYTTHLRESLPLDLSPWPALREHVDRCEALPVFRRHYIPFDAPVP